MHVNLSAEMEGFIKSKVPGGFYGNATEVIRGAIRRGRLQLPGVPVSLTVAKPSTTARASLRTSQKAPWRPCTLGRRVAGLRRAFAPQCCVPASRKFPCQFRVWGDHAVKCQQWSASQQGASDDEAVSRVTV
jgi:hypothetical protein